MYGVVEISGHQYKVKPGDIIDVEKLAQEVGATVDFDKVLFIGGENPQVGLPLVKGAKVAALVVRQGRGRKMLIMKRKPGNKAVKRGHRQSFTGLLITKLVDGTGKTVAIETDNKWAKKYLSK